MALIVLLRRVVILYDLRPDIGKIEITLLLIAYFVPPHTVSPYTLRSFNFSPASLASAPTGATFGFGALSTFPFAFWEVVSLGRSLVKGINSGAPGRYFRSGSGTLKPCSIVSH
jgi:hypothetical protein